jgi:outer membrane murein-binding lipoprotein Lpp
MNAVLWMKRLGWPGLVGVAALAGVLWVERAWLPQQQAQVQQTASDARRLRHELQARADAVQAAASAASSATQAIDPKAGPRAVWAVLWDGLPDASERLALQSGVLSAAKDAGIALGSVQMRGELSPWLDKTQAQGLWRQRALSIDSLDIQRADPMSDQVKAQVTVSLWWRQDRSH